MDNKLSKEEIQKIELEMLKEVNRISREFDLTYYLGYGTALGAIRHEGFIPWDSDVDIIVSIDNYKKFCDKIAENIDLKYELKSIDTDSTYDSLKARVCLKNYIHNVIHIDIFPLVGCPKTHIGKKIFSKIAYLNYRSYFIKKVNPQINYSKNRKKKTIAWIAKLILLPIPSILFKKIFNKLSNMYPIENSNEVYNICGSYGDKEFILKGWLDNPQYKQFESESLPIPKEWDKYLTHIYGDYMKPKKENYI